MTRPAANRLVAILLSLALIALAARLVLIWQYPQSYGDADVYLVVAENIVRNGCVSLSEPAAAACLPHWGGNQLPGFPAFIALNFAFFDQSLTAVRIAQAVLAVLAILYLCLALRAWTQSLSAVVCAGALLALSPLAIGWPRHIFTETLALTVTTWLMAELIWSLTEQRLRSVRVGLVLAVAAFVRIDLLSLCLLVAVCAFLLHRPGPAVRQGLIVLITLSLPLTVWSLRSVSLGLSPLPPLAVMADGSRAPSGILAWGSTWSNNEYHLNLWVFPLLTKSYSEIRPPHEAYADADERARVEALLSTLRELDGNPFPKKVDDAFRNIANARISARPVFHWIVLPLRRAFEMWFNPFSSAGLPAAAELPGAIGPDTIRRALADGIFGVADLIFRYPELALFKAASIGYRVLLLAAVLLICWAMVCVNNPIVQPLLLMALTFAVGRTLAFALTLNNTTRYIVEAAIPLEIACGVFLGLMWPFRPRPPRRISRSESAGH